MNPDVLDSYQERFRYISVDEYQDTNTAQFELVRLLSRKYRNLCVVGDDDQSIYKFRGANIRNILDFEKVFPEAKVVKLEQNYRSTQTILDAANAVIRNNTARKDKRLWTDQEKERRFISEDLTARTRRRNSSHLISRGRRSVTGQITGILPFCTVPTPSPVCWRSVSSWRGFPMMWWVV